MNRCGWRNSSGWWCDGTDRLKRSLGGHRIVRRGSACRLEPRTGRYARPCCCRHGARLLVPAGGIDIGERSTDANATFISHVHVDKRSAHAHFGIFLIGRLARNAADHHDHDRQASAVPRTHAIPPTFLRICAGPIAQATFRCNGRFLRRESNERTAPSWGEIPLGEKSSAVYADGCR